MKISSSHSFFDFSTSEWNKLSDENDPFSELEFLQALEASESIGAKTHWRLKVFYHRNSNGILEFAVPVYWKYDSYGEYIFDFQWAEALRGVGIPYYPKLLVSTPFTPATGSKFLVRSKDPESRKQAVQLLSKSIMEEMQDNNLSSSHFLFLSKDENNFLAEQGFHTRISTQFHWLNRGYQDFSDYLSCLIKKRRKSIQKERKDVVASGVQIQILENEDIPVDIWQTIWKFYQSTTSQKWGQAYLKPNFFERIFQNFRHRMVIVLAQRNGINIGGAINFQKGKNLFGRYWGAFEFVEGLHFECCYYTLIEYALRKGFDKFEAGAQGEHKFLRGFEMVPIYSSHRFLNPSIDQSISSFLERERKLMTNSISQGNLQSPLKIYRKEEL